MSELNKIWKLVKTGFVEPEKRSPLETLFFIGKMLLILILFKIISIGFIFLLDWIGVFEMPKNLNRIRLETLTQIEILLLSSVFAPILEELTFRLPLKFSKWNLIIASIGITLTFCRIIVELEYIYSSIISIGFGIILHFILTAKIIGNLSKLWANNKLLLFYTLLMTFSFLHLKNYEMTAEVLLFSPIIILPRILGGLVFSYIRMNSGIILAICFHSFNNGIFRVITMLID